MKKTLNYIICLIVACIYAMPFTSCSEIEGPTSPIVGVWETLDDCEHCFVFGNQGDYVDAYRQQSGEEFGVIRQSGLYFYNGTEITFVNPKTKDTHMYYIELENGEMHLTSSVTNEQINLKFTRDTRGLLFSE